MLIFTGSFTTLNNGLSIVTNPFVAVVNQGTTYYLRVKTMLGSLVSGYDVNLENMELRVVFPP